MLDWLLWWTGLAAWMLVGGGIVVWSGFFIAHRITDIVFVRRIAAVNVRWKVLPRRERWRRYFLFYCHIVLEMPTVVEVQISDHCWRDVFYPGHAAMNERLDEWPAGHGEQPL